MPWRVLLVLALLAGVADAQPVLIPWRPPAGCTDGQAIVYDTTTRLWQCGSAGITNAAGNNVIPKSDADGNLVASSATDNGTTFAINTNKFTVTESSGNTSIAGTLGVTGAATLTGGFTLGADSSAGSHKITNLTNGTASSDAAAFGQIASAVNAAVSGTSGRSARLTGSNTIGTGAFTDDGTNASIGGTLDSATAYTLTGIGANSGVNAQWGVTSFGGAGTIGIGTTSNHDFVIGTNSIERMRVSNTGTASITGLLTATAGVTTPANLTTTGTGDLVSGDDLTVADAATINGLLTASAGGAFSSTTVPYKFGDAAGVYILNRTINCGYDTNADATCVYNNVGYNGGTTRFRSFDFRDGKGASILTLTGSTKAAEFFGAADFDSTVNVDDDLTANADVNIGGSTTIDGTLAARGSLNVIGNANTDTLTITAKIDSNVHYTGTATSVSSCGTASASVTGNNRRGKIIPGTGSPTSCTLNFAGAGEAWLSAPVCQVSGAKGTEKVASVSTTTLVITVPSGWASAAGGGADEPVYYSCDGL